MQRQVNRISEPIATKREFIYEVDTDDQFEFLHIAQAFNFVGNSRVLMKMKNADICIDLRTYNIFELPTDVYEELIHEWDTVS